MAGTPKTSAQQRHACIVVQLNQHADKSDQSNACNQVCIKEYSWLLLEERISSFGILAVCVLNVGELYRKLLRTGDATDTVVEASINFSSILINDGGATTSHLQ